MAASPLTLVTLVICGLVLVSVTTGSVVPSDGHSHNRVARQIPGNIQEKADAARQNFHDAASAGAQRAQDLAEAARSHITQRVRRDADYHHADGIVKLTHAKDPASDELGARYQSGYGRGHPVAYGRPRRGSLYLERRDEIARERDERHREREERQREREEREREREQDERERERDERRREDSYRGHQN